MAPQRAWLIDASIYIFRAWFSLPDQWHTRDGWPVNAVYGYSKFLLDFIDRARPGPHCAAAFDESLGSCFRNEIYPDYKRSRELPDDSLAFQLRACREISERMGLPCYGSGRYEADDYIATLARLYRQRNVPVTLVTRDKDLGQLLLAPEDHWLDFAAGSTLDAAGFQERFGVAPNQFADYLALVGDKVDDIPGVPGVGAKTAARLLQAFGSIRQLGGRLDELATLDIRGAKGLPQKLRDHWPQLEMAGQLTVLESEIPGLETPGLFRLSPQGVESVVDYLGELNIGGAMLRRWQQLERELRGR
jgi:5'-3' exonuclease